jgi:hypothetical protein
MSNKGNDLDDFRFDNDDDDLFGDQRDDDFSFADDDEPIDPDSDIDFGIADDDDIGGMGDDEFQQTGGERQGPSRGFIIIAAIFIILLLAGLGLLIGVLSGAIQPPLTGFDMTATAITEINATRIVQIAASQTASFEQANETATAMALGGTQTAEAAELAVTQTAEAFNVGLTQTAEAAGRDLTSTVMAQTAQAQGTQLAATSAAQTATAEAQAGTSVAQALTATTPAGEVPTTPAGGSIPLESVFQTATALAGVLNTPTIEVIIPTAGSGGAITPTPRVTALPDSGIFDDLAGSSGGPGILFLMAFGLVGVIAMARGLRANNNNKS